MAEIIARPVSKLPRLNKSPLGLVGLVVVVLVAAGFFLYRHHQDQQKAKNQPYAYTYKDLRPYKLASPVAGSGISFSMPTQFSVPLPSGTKSPQAEFDQTVIKNNRHVIVGSLAVSSVHASSPPTAVYLKSLGQSITNPQSKSYATAVEALHDYVTQRLGPSYGITFDPPKNFSNPNIKSNAWKASYTATVKAGQGDAISNPPLKGDAILAIGKSTFYYYSLYSVDYNQTANSDSWQQLINSLKIDQ